MVVEGRSVGTVELLVIGAIAAGLGTDVDGKDEGEESTGNGGSGEDRRARLAGCVDPGRTNEEFLAGGTGAEFGIFPFVDVMNRLNSYFAVYLSYFC